MAANPIKIRKSARKESEKQNGRGGVLQGAADRDRAVEALRDSEERFRATFEQAAVGIAHTTTEGRFLQVNRRLCEILGYSDAELLQLTTRELTHPDDRDRQDALRLELLSGRRSSFSVDKRLTRKDGSAIWINRTVTLARRPTTGEVYLIQVIEDISERKQTEARLGRLSRARSVMAECGHILVHAADEAGMLERMCRVVVETGGYKMAWVGFATADPMRSIYPAAHAGFGDDSPMGGNAAWSADGRYQGFMSEVMASGEPHIARNILHDPAHARRRARAVQRGFQSSIALPLKGDGRILGAIAMYAAEPDAFDDEEITLLRELSDDIAFGLVSLRERIARRNAEAALRESELRFRETFEQAAVGITRVDLDGVLVDANEKFCEMLGYGRGELLGKRVRDITHPGDYGVGARYRAELTHRALKSASGEKRFIRKDGGVLWARRTMSTACDANGKPLYVISVVEDITERKELERQFELTFNQAAVGMTQVGLDGRLLQVNQKYADMLGYTREELCRMRTEDLTHPEDRDETVQMRQKLLDREIENASSEKRLVRKDGRVIWVNRTFSLARDVSGEPLHYIAVVEDITGRKEAEAERAQLAAIVENSNDAIITRDLDRTILTWNPGAEKLFGWTAQEAIGQSILLIVPPERHDENTRQRELVHQGLSVPAYDTVRLTRDGRRIAVSLSQSAIKNNRGEVIAISLVFHDIAEREELERRYRETFDQAAVGIVHTSADGRYLRVNQKFCGMLGYGESELVGRAAADFTHPDDRDMSRESRQLIWDGKLDKIVEEKRYIRKDGSAIWTNRTISLARDAAGKPDYFIRVIEDITERKAAEERYRATFDSAPVGILHTTVDGYRILRANRKLCEMLGYSQDELLRMTSTDIVHPDYRFSDRSSYLDQMLNGEIQSFASERKFIRKDGSSLWVNRTVSLVKDASGEPLYFIRIIEDITDRKRAEEAVAREQALLHTVVDALPDHIYVKDLDGRYLLVNETGLRVRGITAHEEVVGKTAADFVPAEAAKKYDQEDRQVIESGKPLVDREEKAASRGSIGEAGDVKWHLTTKVPLRDAQGKVVGIVGVNRDITEQKQSVARRAMEHAVTRVLAESLTLAEAMPKIIRAMCEAMGWAYGARWAWDEGEQRLRRAEYWCEFEPEFDPADRELWLKVANTGTGRLLRRAWIDKKATWLANLHDDKPFRRRASVVKLGWHSAYAFPIQIGNDVIGVMEFFGPARREPDEALLQVTGSISSQIGQFVQRKRAEAALRESEEQFRQLANNIPQVFWISDIGHRDTIYVSPAADALTGRPLQALYARRRALVQSVHPEDRRRVYEARKSAADGGYDQTFRVVRPDGAVRWVNDRAFPVSDEAGRVYRIAGITEDVTDRKLAEERLLQLAHYDLLTSLPNRVLFYDRLKQVLAQAKRNEWIVGVLFVDLDRFKNVNDTLGHAVGDQLLQQVSERLTRSVRSGDTVGRLGGDEFAIVLSNLSSAQDANLVAQKIMASFAGPFKLGGSEIYVTASIGITLYPDDSTDQDELIRNADSAMYRAKEMGRNSFQYYTPEMNSRALEILGMESSLRGALDRGEFLLHYQPKASIADGSIVGVEALLRWQHPERGLVSPADFMFVLEETGLIVQVGEWVLRQVCAQIKAWERAGIAPLPVAVNLSARQFNAKDFGMTIGAVLREQKVHPGLIELEITESSLMMNTEEAARTLEYLSTLGVGLSIDDFGTGYSSLSYLKRFPLDALKIDRSFVRDITTDNDDATITRAVISMAHSLGLKVIAEGVETAEQLAFLAEHGCDEIQGYYFSRPMPAEECGIWLAEKRRLQGAQPAAEPGVPSVLLVNDDDDALMLLKHTLDREGYRILLARNGGEAIEAVKRQRVDIVVADQNMPGTSGADLLRHIRITHPDIVRLMTSAHTDLKAIADAISRGEIFRYLPRENTPDQTRASVREALLARRPPLPAATRPE